MAYRHANNTVSAHGAVVVTPSDSAVIPATRGLWVNGAGDITVDMADSATNQGNGANTNITFTVTAGSPIPLQVIRIYSTGTTATGIRALY